MKYTVDRIEKDIVVLLQKGDESIQKDVPVSLFPSEIKDGDIVEEIIENEKVIYHILHEETQEQRKKAEALLEKLKNRNQK